MLRCGPHCTHSHAGAKPDVIFTGCNISNGMSSAAGGHRRQVVVNGKRVKTVDAHAHCHVMEAWELVGRHEEVRPGEPLGELEHDRIREMDEQGVDVEALSSNPFWYHCERDLAAEVVKVQNTKLAELCAKRPDRFVGYAGVALQYPDLAIQQLEEAVKKFGMRGVAVGANVNGEDFSNPKYHPFWAKAEELDVLVFIHPLFATSGLKTRLGGNGWLANVIGNPLETTIALSHLIFEGTLDRFPSLKILAAHGGGYLPFYAARSDAAAHVPAQVHRNQSTGITLKKKPSEYLRQLYFDSLVFTPEALQYLARQVGSGQIVIGSDHPVGWVKDPVTHILDTPGFSDAERVAMLGETARRLLRIEA